MRTVLTALAGLMLMAAPSWAQDGWTTLATPADNGAVIDTNPMQGFYDWIDAGIVPVSRPATDHYTRFTWAELEPREGVYDFSPLEKALAALGPKGRLAFGVMPMDTCCSQTGVDVPAYLKDKMARGWWIKADPGNWTHVAETYVPDWNDPYYIERWRQLWQAIGAKYNGDPRIAWVDLRGYGNWGEGHIAGASAYQDTHFPYGDTAANTHGAAPGTLETRLAIADAIADALPDTQLLSMTDDKDMLLHALRRPQRVPIGMRRDSWGSLWFENYAQGDLAPEDRALILDRWKTAPFVVESYGWTKVFEAGDDGIVRQIATHHVSAIGNGNFSVHAWSDLSRDHQTALIQSGAVAGYRYLPAAVRVKSSGDCPLDVAIDWRNNGVAPAYDPWRVRLWIKAGGAMKPLTVQSEDNLPRLLPGEPQTVVACYSRPGDVAAGRYDLYVQLADPRSPRTMALPLDGGDGDDRYPLGTASIP